jgi:gliding motility-associated protein GldM
MAGGKETPRQQMINMMYIVLTAMLALQVSSSIIDKFLFLNDALEVTQADSKTANDSAFAALEREVAETGPKAKPALDKAKEIRANAKDLLEKIAKLKEELIAGPGGGIDKETGKMVNPKEETKVEITMVGANKTGKGYQLEKDLNAFVAFLNEKVKFDTPLEPLAKGNADKPIYKNDQFNRNKDYAQANFGQTPVAAALAVLTHAQSEVLRYEALALKQLGAEAAGQVIKFDKIQGIATAESNVVAEGDKYRAKMFLFASASNLKMNMTVNGQPLTDIKDGVGNVEFLATGGSQEGAIKKWTGTISFNNKGNDTTFTFEQEYKVVTPVMTIQSASVQALYEGCGNELVVLVPALGSSYDPSFSGANAVFIKGAAKGQVTVVPTSLAEVTLSVSSGGRTIGTEKFKVRKVPRAFLALNDITENDAKSGIKMPRSVSVTVKPDESFAAFLPKEANYRINGGKVTLTRAGRPVGSKPITGNVTATSDLAAQAKPGDILLVEVTSVSRSNFRGELKPAELANKYFSIPIK